MSSDIEKNLIALHGCSSLFMSAASREREDALPQTPECTNSTGLFKEAAGKNQFQFTLSKFFLTENWKDFMPTLSTFQC